MVLELAYHKFQKEMETFDIFNTLNAYLKNKSFFLQNKISEDSIL
jgi:hypothetical protein